jgi:hypothetical protein
MIVHNESLNQLEIIIPRANVKDLLRYRTGLLWILGEIKVEDCNQDRKENLKAVYEVLHHLTVDDSKISKFAIV